MNVRVEHSEVVYRGRVFEVHKDIVDLPNGKQAQIDVISHRSSVTILPLDDQGQVWFMR